MEYGETVKTSRRKQEQEAKFSPEMAELEKKNNTHTRVQLFLLREKGQREPSGGETTGEGWGDWQERKEKD